LKRILIAGLLAGLVLFVWEFAAHEFLPLGEAGFQPLPNEAATLAVMRDAIRQPGLYLFPAPEFQPDMTTAQKQEAMQKSMDRALTGPTGLMVFHPNGVPFSFSRNLAIQFGADVVVMWICAWILALVTRSASYWQLVIIAMLLGFIPVLRTEIPYWNWYNFPAVYTLSQTVIHVVGLTLGGMILAKLVRGAPG
jgi:hypothetical protein